MDLVQLFEMIDVDNSGFIEANEFIRPLSRWVRDSKTAPRVLVQRLSCRRCLEQRVFLFNERLLDRFVLQLFLYMRCPYNHGHNDPFLCLQGFIKYNMMRTMHKQDESLGLKGKSLPTIPSCPNFSAHISSRVSGSACQFSSHFAIADVVLSCEISFNFHRLQAEQAALRSTLEAHFSNLAKRIVT